MKRQVHRVERLVFQLDTEITLRCPIDRLDVVPDVMADNHPIAQVFEERLNGRSFTYAFTAFVPGDAVYCHRRTGVSERNHFFEGVT